MTTNEETESGAATVPADDERIRVASREWIGQWEPLAAVRSLAPSLRLPQWEVCGPQVCGHLLDGACWRLPDRVAPIPRADEATTWALWVEVVAEHLGETDARVHQALQTQQRSGDALIVERDAGRFVFEAFDEPASDGGRWALTLATVSARGGLVVTEDRRVWHTRVPETIGLVPMGHNLGAYMWALRRVVDVTPSMIRLLCAHYWIGAVSAMGTRSVPHPCLCGLPLERHRPDTDRVWTFARHAANRDA